MSIAELDGLEDVDGADDTVAYEAEAETDGVYEFVAVFLTKLSVEVWEEVVECVDVIVGVLEPTCDLETVGEADRVLETRAEAETVLVLYILLVTIEVLDWVLRAVEVLETELDLVFVGELVWDLDTIELKEFVGDCDTELETRELPEYEDVLEEDAVNVGVTVRIGIDVNFALDECVKELYGVNVNLDESVGEAELDRVILDDTDELAEALGVFVNWIVRDAVAVWNLGVWVILGENVVVAQLVEVLLGLEVNVLFDVAVDERVELVLADLVLVPNPLADTVGVDEVVLEDMRVLDIDGDPVDVLELVSVLVSVELIRGVNVPLGDSEADAEAVGVLEGRIDNVSVGEEVVVLDWGDDLV